MNAETVIDLQNRIVLVCSGAIYSKWENAFVNVEIDSIDGEQTENLLCVHFCKEGGKWTSDSFSAPIESYDLFNRLRAETSDPEPWKNCMLEFDSTGKYRFSYSHDRPRRIYGDYSDEAMLEHYIPKPL
ncbi:hypothetical protein [Calycomorphotria hydatis]|uniref:DUF600 domain-containing protein n=1 Tax=Calycomorphotria hydatis TaxID=2528027 RepID=A0A517T762_9PLAN|nr:hypothetical protein [Calycomorphotria hydatis]QDT64190.1 hypothetical protein V22_14210 [Calycomorphotria hydatis]